MATVERLVTADELLRMPEPSNGASYELMRGELIRIAPAGGRHGMCCLAVGSILRAFVSAQCLGTVASNDTGVFTERNPDTVLGPDIAYWSRARLPEIPAGFVEVPPDLAVEVVSPSDTHEYIHKKVLQYLDHGVQLVWVVDPDARTVTAYRSRHEVRILAADEEIDGSDVLPGFASPVSEFFE